MYLLAVAIQLILFVCLSFSQILIGRRILIHLLGFPVNEGGRWELCLVLGLGTVLLGGFLLECVGIPWGLIVFGPLALLYLDRAGVRWCLTHVRIEPHLNLCLWLAAILFLGLSLIDVADGIRTPWTNNFGDFAFHMGMMSSFAFGGNIPPEYHIFPGERLSYPFLHNYWTALLWRVTPHAFQFLEPAPNYFVLPLI